MNPTDVSLLNVIELKYALNTLYLLFSGILIMWMAAGFSMLEAGLVRSKNTAEILTKNVLLYAIASVTYLLVGYKLMYPEGEGLSAWLPPLGFGVKSPTALGDLDSAAPGYASGADFFFQVVFVATSMSIVSGAVAERMKLMAFLCFAVVFTAFIYPIQGYWKWGGGILEQLDFFDYAGSGVVHMSGACAALVGVLLLGARKGKYTEGGQAKAIPGSNLPLAALGTLILWMGWFGFNGGSELAIANWSAANNVSAVLINTNTAAAGGILTSFIVALVLFRKADLTMVLNGALAGLVVITADPLSPSPLLSLIYGAAGGLTVVFSILVLDKMKIDDPVGAISVHGVCGILGLLVVPIANADATIVAQLSGIGLIALMVSVLSLLVWLVIKYTIGLRVSEEDEYVGADISECGLSAYPEFAPKNT